MTFVRLVNPPLTHGHEALVEREGDEVLSITFLDECRPARATGSWLDVWERLPTHKSPGSRANLIRCAAAILNAKYAAERVQWRLVTPLITKEQIAHGQ